MILSNIITFNKPWNIRYWFKSNNKSPLYKRGWSHQWGKQSIIHQISSLRPCIFLWFVGLTKKVNVKHDLELESFSKIKQTHTCFVQIESHKRWTPVWLTFIGFREGSWFTLTPSCGQHKQLTPWECDRQERKVGFALRLEKFPCVCYQCVEGGRTETWFKWFLPQTLNAFSFNGRCLFLIGCYWTHQHLLMLWCRFTNVQQRLIDVIISMNQYSLPHSRKSAQRPNFVFSNNCIVFPALQINTDWLGEKTVNLL